MSAEQRPAAGFPTDERTATDRYCAARSRTDSDRQQPVTDSDSHPTDTPLYVRIEYTQLRLQVAALERALERSERRRQAVIDRYERLLADRQTAADETSPSGGPLEAVLARLRGP